MPSRHENLSVGVLNADNIVGGGALTNIPVGQGKRLYVDSVHGSNGNPGTDPRYAKSSIFGTTGALAYCTNSHGDQIICLPGHVETIDAAADGVFNKIGVTVWFLGEGSNRAYFNFGTGAVVGSDFDVSAAGVTLINPVFVSAIDALTGPIHVAAADFTIKNGEYHDAAAKAVTHAIVATSAADRLTIDGWKYFVSTTGTQKHSNIQLAGGDHITLKNIQIEGDFNVAPIEGTAACTNIVLEDIYVNNTNIGPLPGLNLHANTTGFAKNVKVRVASGTTYVTSVAKIQWSFDCEGFNADGIGSDPIGTASAVTIEGKVDAIKSDLIISQSDVKVIDARMKVTNSDMIITHSDVKAMNTRTITIASDLVISHSDIKVIDARVKVTNSDMLITHSDVKVIDARVKVTNSDMLITHSDVKVIISDLVLTRSDVVTTQSDLKDLMSDMLITHSDVKTILSDLNDLRSDMLITHSDVKVIISDLLLTRSDVVTTQSDLKDLMSDMLITHSDVKTILSDLNDLRSDMLITHSDVKTILSDLNDLRSDMLITHSDVKVVISDLSDVWSDIVIIQSDVKIVDRNKDYITTVDLATGDLTGTATRWTVANGPILVKHLGLEVTTNIPAGANTLKFSFTPTGQAAADLSGATDTASANAPQLFVVDGVKATGLVKVTDIGIMVRANEVGMPIILSEGVIQTVFSAGPPASGAVKLYMQYQKINPSATVT